MGVPATLVRVRLCLTGVETWRVRWVLMALQGNIFKRATIQTKQCKSDLRMWRQISHGKHWKDWNFIRMLKMICDTSSTYRTQVENRETSWYQESPVLCLLPLENKMNIYLGLSKEALTSDQSASGILTARALPVMGPAEEQEFPSLHQGLLQYL